MLQEKLIKNWDVNVDDIINQYNIHKQYLEKNIGDVDIKISDTRCLVTTTILNTIFSEVENKMRNTSSFVTTTVLNTKISEVVTKIPDHGKYIITQEKITAEIL